MALDSRPISHRCLPVERRRDVAFTIAEDLSVQKLVESMIVGLRLDTGDQITRSALERPFQKCLALFVKVPLL